MDIKNKFEDNLRRQKKLFDPRFVLTVKKESKYGNELIYPICERAKLIVKLFVSQSRSCSLYFYFFMLKYVT